MKSQKKTRVHQVYKVSPGDGGLEPLTAQPQSSSGLHTGLRVLPQAWQIRVDSALGLHPTLGLTVCYWL